MKAEKEDAQPRVQTLTVLSRSRTKRIMQNEKTGTGGSRCRFCLWYGLWAECKENYVNINCNKKVAIFSKVKAKTATFLSFVAEKDAALKALRLNGFRVLRNLCFCFSALFSSHFRTPI